METTNEFIVYDLIVVGSGNGACGFLSHYLQTRAEKAPRERILVIEEGKDFFNTSDITHQNNWTQSYAEGNVFKLHNALTPKGIPIISGRACAMGGGGSINYTMIHESSEWLSQHIGFSISYWNELKAELNKKFDRPNPMENPSKVTKHILKSAHQACFKLSNDDIENIPNYHEENASLLYPFPTQFNRFGQRTHSGVSLIDWSDSRLTLLTRCRVEHIEWEKTSDKLARCVSVQVKNLDTGKTVSFSLSSTGKLLLCAGAATPRLLMPHRELLANNAIGQQASDHIVLPLGIYVLDPTIPVTGKDAYLPVFATTLWQPEKEKPGKEKKLGKETVCCFDFFSGNFERLWYLISHFYLAFLLPNWLKRIVIRVPWLFYIIKNGVRILIGAINFLINILWGISRLLQGKSWEREQYNLITAIVKFNPAIEGYYVQDKKRIDLNFFTPNQETNFNQDIEVAQSVISRQLEFLNHLGQQPHWFVKFIIRLFTKVPYEKKQVLPYINTYRRRFLLSEQHLSGGCLFGKAIDQGLENPQSTGNVFGSTNVYVADLSAVSLPRISPQMTAYLIGFHVAKRICHG